MQVSHAAWAPRGFSNLRFHTLNIEPDASVDLFKRQVQDELGFTNPALRFNDMFLVDSHYISDYKIRHGSIVEASEVEEC